MSSVVEMKRSVGHSSIPSSADKVEVPFCLKRLVRTIVRSFYSREHSLIIDLLVRNTIMKEDDLCERLCFEKKQLRQHLHSLKTDQFIKSKLQLETDAEGKIAKIIHYFIDYKVFVNIVKYRLDQMQRRLEAEQRQTSSRALFLCLSCNSSYTDLEVDRLLDPNMGKLICVYCRADVREEEDNAQRSDARALVAKFQQQVRGPLDALLKECDRVHLSSSILEPDFRALEPLPGATSDMDASGKPTDPPGLNSSPLDPKNISGLGEGTVTIVLDGKANTSTFISRERPIWMSESTINSVRGSGLGELDRGGSGGGGGFSSCSDPNTQTLAPGRVPTSLHDISNSTDGALASGQSTTSSSSANPNSASSEIMQLLRVHERRGLGSHGPKSALNRPNSVSTYKCAASSSLKNGHNFASKTISIDQDLRPPRPEYVITVRGVRTPLYEITPALVRTMTPNERAEYVEVGRKLYRETVVE